MARRRKRNTVTSQSANGRADDKREGLLLGRRDFLKLGGLSGSAVGLATAGCELLPGTTVDFSSMLVRREDQLALRFDFINLKLEDASEGGQQIVRKSALQPSYVVVHFEPQNIFEERFLEKPLLSDPPADQKQPTLGTPVEHRIAGPSRVVLKVPSGTNPIPWSGEGLLEALGTLEMSVAANALPPDDQFRVDPNFELGPLLGGQIVLVPVAKTSTAEAQRRRNLLESVRTASHKNDLDLKSLAPVAPGINAEPAAPVVQQPVFQIPIDVVPAFLKPVPAPPRPVDTALEMPFRLILSPNLHGGWAHIRKLVDALKLGRYELWHTRLGVRNNTTGAVDESSEQANLRTVRAIWTRDFGPSSSAVPPTSPPPSATLPFRGSLEPFDRVQITHLSSNFRTLLSPYKPKPVDVNRLMLSTLGGWLDLHAKFDPALTVLGWDHKASLGRDYFVQVICDGRLVPCGHRGVLIKVTERKFRDSSKTVADDSSVGYLWTRFFIIPTERVRPVPPGWRKLPFSSLILKTIVTPDLEGEMECDKANPIVVNGKPFRFKMDGIDLSGKTVPFSDGMVASWVPLSGGTVMASQLPAAVAIYSGTDGSGLYKESDRRSSFGGQRITFAPSGKPDDTTYETADILFDANTGSSSPYPAGIGYLAGVQKANIKVEAIRGLTGQDTPKEFSYHNTFLQHGFTDAGGDNPGELLFETVGGKLATSFAKKSDASGGFVAPSLDISGLSRRTGPVAGSDLTKIASGHFKPSEFLDSIDAKIFGVLDLKDILKEIASAAGLDNAPNFITQSLDQVTGFLEDGLALYNKIVELGMAADSAANAVKTKINQLVGADGVVESKIKKLIGASDFATLKTEVEGILDGLLADLASLQASVDGLTGVSKTIKEDIKRRAKALADVIEVVKTGLEAFAKGYEMAKNLTVKLEWRAKLQSFLDSLFEPLVEEGFLLAVEVRAKDVGNKKAGADIVAGIEKFNINLFGKSAKIVTIKFKHLLFKVESGKKPDVDVVFDDEGGGNGMVFDGVLAFVDKLRQIIPSNGFSDPPEIEVDAEGIRSGFSIGLPTIAVGMFSLQNISIGAGFHIPFIGNPLSISFNFCTREEPFVLTVWIIGGGGFFNIEVSPKGVQLLEAAFEAGLAAALDFGVASGSCSIMLGIYLRIELEEGSLTGYLRIKGQVDVLGLITASIMMLMELIYEFSSGKVTGRCTIEIEVSICFISFTVSVTCERKFAGSNEDPGFLDSMAPYPDPVLGPVKPWDEYLESFALAA